VPDMFAIPLAKLFFLLCFHDRRAPLTIGP
jgi:hypothetical protein